MTAVNNRVQPIQKVAVIGAGVMGAGIAAQAANGGAEVLLLDIVPPDAEANAESRNRIAQRALQGFISAGAAGGLMHGSVAERIQVGNIEDHVDQLYRCDWIIEAVVEKLDVKQSLYKRIEQVRGPHAIVSSNTSTIPLVHLVEGMSPEFQQHFVVTHFFNPPRYMRLVEIVAGLETLPEVVERVSIFNDYRMGKRVIRCTDRPGFIANRLGVFWMQVALQEAIGEGLSVEEADAVMQVCGFPKTGIFGLWDLCGLDLMPQVTQSLGKLLPESDDFAAYSQPHPVVLQMLEKGRLGRKGRTLQGFYRQQTDDRGKRLRQVVDLNSLDYREPQRAALDSAGLRTGQLKALLKCNDKGGHYAWRVLSKMLCYATRLVGDVCDNIRDIDVAMKLGYNWRYGPFELIDLIGIDDFTRRLTKEGLPLSPFLQAAGSNACYRNNPVPSLLDGNGQYQPLRPIDGVLDLATIKQRLPVRQFSQCAIWDLGDQVWCVEFSAKVPTLNPTLLAEIDQALQLAIAELQALVFYKEGPVFVAGADLKVFLDLTTQPDGISQLIRQGQQLFSALQSAPIPVVGAVSGTALGGGLELLLHCHAIQAHADTRLGLVESSVGIVPGWGGCRELLARCAERFGHDQAIPQAFELLRSAKVSSSALEASKLGFLRDTDGITMNQDRLLYDAKHKAMELRRSPEVSANQNRLPVLVPAQGLQLAEEGYQATLESALLHLLNHAGEEGWHQRFYDLECACNQQLVRHAEALARIEHLLKTGKPLSN